MANTGAAELLTKDQARRLQRISPSCQGCSRTKTRMPSNDLQKPVDSRILGYAGVTMRASELIILLDDRPKIRKAKHPNERDQ